MSDLPTTNSAASFAGKTVREVFTSLIPVAEAAIIASAPVMATPVLIEVWEELFTLAVDAMAKEFGDGTAFIVIDIQTYVQIMSVAKAIAALKVAQSVGSPDDITKARAAADSAAVSLLNYSGDAHS